MPDDEHPWLRVKAWVARHPDLELWLRWVSPAFLYSALDARLSFDEALREALSKRLPHYARRRTVCLGGAALLLFANQVITGVLLTVYYKPATEAALASLQFVEQQTTLGFLIRQMHAWGGNLLILLLLLHMGKVFFNRAYRHPREMTWLSGALLLLVALAFGFTGYLLPWDQTAYWGTISGTELIGQVPLVGHLLLTLLWGGVKVSELTISRFFAVHCLVLPWIILPLLAAHFAMIRRLGISEPL